VLVVDIPETEVSHDTLSIGHLEEHSGVGIAIEGASDGGDKPGRPIDVFQSHLAAHKVGPDVLVPLRVIVGDELGPRVHVLVAECDIGASTHIGRVKAYPPILAELTEKVEEFALTAADLEDMLAVEVVLLDKPLGQALRKGAKGG